MDGDKVLLAPAVLAHAHVALLPAVLLHHCGEDLGSLLEGYQERCMPAHHAHLCGKLFSLLIPLLYTDHVMFMYWAPVVGCVILQLTWLSA